MSKKKNKRKKSSSASAPAQAQATITMSSDELEKVIAGAILIAREEEAKKEEQERISDIYRLKDKADILKTDTMHGWRKSACENINSFLFILKLPVLKFDSTTENYFTISAIKIVMVFVLTVIQIILLLTELLLIFFVISLFFTGSIQGILYGLLLLFVNHLLLGLCHTIKNEIAQMKDITILITLFSVFLAVPTLVVSILALFKG